MSRRRYVHPGGTASRLPRFAVGFVFAACVALLSTQAGARAAAPRDDAIQAFLDAAVQLDALEVDQALATLDTAIASAHGQGLEGDPSLASLHAMRAGLIFSLNQQDRAQTLAALKQAVACDYNVEVPIELRSQELVSLLAEAKASIERPAGMVIHDPPAAVKGTDIEFKALFNTPIPGDAQLVLYWRRVGDEAEFKSMYMSKYTNFGVGVVTAAEHGDVDLEYFFYALDAQNQGIANRGDRETPMVLQFTDAPVGVGAEGGGEKGDDKKDKKDKKKKRDPNKSGLARVFINLGFGLGLGVARGQAELTFQQYTPGTPTAVYSAREQACAVERWFEAGAPLANDPATFGVNVAQIQSAGADILPNDPTTLQNSYDAAYCRQHHPVSTGLALAPFHIAPEVGVRVHRAIVISLFGRLQVVTGSKVFTDDPNKELNESFLQDVRSPDPPGHRQRPPFTWGLGAKFKYFFGRDEAKFRVYAGVFAGFGRARLRVPMGFSNDRNGNSVPDTVETALHGMQDVDGNIIPETCVAVWPYNQGCTPGAAGDPDRTLAQTVRTSTSSSDERIDTVRIGPGFVGALVGFNYQIIKNLAVFAELDIGGYFPATSSILFDLNVGPAITF